MNFRPGHRAALSLLVFVTCSLAHAQWTPLNPVTGFSRQQQTLTVHLQRGTLRLRVDTPSLIHVRYSPTTNFPAHPQFVVLPQHWTPVQWTVDEDAKAITLSTRALSVRISRQRGDIRFSDHNGQELFDDASRTMTPALVNGEHTYHSETFVTMYGSQEGLYGLGQHQNGVWNYHGANVWLAQENTQIAIPMLLSSKGYGVFWNNTSRTRFNNRFVHSLYISSEVADTIDYYFMYGPEFDSIVAQYRRLTGAAPLFGKWAYGFWQCKNRYQSQQEILDIAQQYRQRHIPVDNIVQDWFWWKIMGQPVFNDKYPHPTQMIDQLHREHFHIMFSFWPYFEQGSPQYSYMDAHHWLVAKTIVAGFHPLGMALYDATNPAARHYYWNLMNQGLFSRGADAWWLDTDEPETEGRQNNILIDHHLAIGSGARYANIFPLLHTQGVYDGQRRASNQKRVFILSRSGFAGIQRNSVTAWSGDVLSDFESFKRQIPAGLNFSVSGVPYWTTDIGGFFIGNPDDPHFRELFVRWFQFGTFCPIFRVHGTRTTNTNELWSYGPQAETILTHFDRLRYRLMPYIYSEAWQVTHNSYTLMRPLVMDFRTDTTAQNIGDQYMFGPALLVNPVTEPGATSRQLYLPKASWYDFWTGATLNGGRWINAAAPLASMPLYVRAGSILPMGPEEQYTGEKPGAPIEVRVYPGANGSFTLYDDQGDGYAYEKGAYATIHLQWNDAQKTLAIGARQGNYPGMPHSRTFRIVLVRPGHGVGERSTAAADKVVNYNGSPLSVRLR